ncbi:MAG TPA: acetylglutamate kinase [Bryobacteraceae bacterium]|nr:acetylglutamate kinase [Bryobacteraceae bacterium]
MKALIKLGGTLLDSPDVRARLAGEIRDAVQRGVQITVVHGGGKQLTRYLAERGGESRFIDGLRVTTPETMDAVLKILAGSVNQELVAALAAEGLAAVGLTGVDAYLVEAEPMSRQLGQVGRITRANPELLDVLIGRGYIPVVACIAGDRKGCMYNVNADQMAAACAAAWRADRLLFLTDIAGVLDAHGEIRPALTAEDCRALIAAGVAKGGMQAKLNAATAALDHGVEEIRIAPGAAAGVIARLLAGEPGGTRIVHAREQVTSHD